MPSNAAVIFWRPADSGESQRCDDVKVLHEHAIDRLEGFVPAVADWHARMNLVKVLPIDVCYVFHCCIYRLFGTDCTRHNPHVIREHFTNSGI